MIINIFSTHFYEWNGEIYLQTEGCPMGVRPSGPASRLLVDEVVEEIIPVKSVCKKQPISQQIPPPIPPKPPSISAVIYSQSKNKN